MDNRVGSELMDYLPSLIAIRDIQRLAIYSNESDTFKIQPDDFSPQLASGTGYHYHNRLHDLLSDIGLQ